MTNIFQEEVEQLLSKMTLKEKVGQLNQIPAPKDRTDVNWLKEKIRHGEIGSIILAFSETAGNDPQRDTDVEIYNELQRCAVEEGPNGIPLIFGRDVIHGHRTVMPIPLASAGSFDPELVEKCYSCVALEAANDGVHWTFSPMLDVCHDPRWGRIIEGPGEDPYLASVMAKAIVRGFQGEDYSAKGKLAACAKHFLGYGASEGGRDYFRTELSDYTIYNMILPPFRAAVEAGVATVMSSFNDINGQPVTASRKYLMDLLRDYLGFRGFVVADWAALSNLKRQGIGENYEDCSALALRAGLDMDMVDEFYHRALENLVRSGEIPEELVDNAVRNVLRIKMDKGLFRQPYTIKQPVDRSNHLQNAYDLAAASMILLKNDRDLLPLSKDCCVALAGPFKQERRALLGSWVLDGKEDETEHFREAMERTIYGHSGCVICDPDDTAEDAVEKVFASADVVVLALGESHLVTGERNSVADIGLTPHQVELARKAHRSGKKVVGVVFCGRPVALQSVEPYLDAILCAWHCGSCTAGAAADILFGDAEPGGRAPVTFVRTSGHIPMYYNTTPSGLPVNGYYGENSEKNYLDNPGKPMYPFGYGLTYTSFSYSSVSVDTEQMSMDDLRNGGKFHFTVCLHNTGARAGTETVQLYVRDRICSVMRPLRELKAFCKRTLQAGEREDVSFAIGYEELGFYTSDGSYTVEPGAFDIYIGENCLTANMTTIRVTA